jgi:hypothetical protein
MLGAELQVRVRRVEHSLGNAHSLSADRELELDSLDSQQLNGMD